MGDLPAHYIAADGERVSVPVYRLLAPCFFADTFWEEGEEIMTNECPNHHMQPLNKAAGERMEEWLLELPDAGENIRPDDLLEAAMMLRPREGEPVMETKQWQQACLKLARELKARRDGKNAPQPLPMPQTMAASRGGVPPMPNAKFGDPRVYGFGQRGEPATAVAGAQRGRARAVKPMGNVPRQV